MPLTKFGKNHVKPQIICHRCLHKIEPEQKLCHLIIVDIKYLMHYDCAVEVKKRATKILQNLNIA